MIRSILVALLLTAVVNFSVLGDARAGAPDGCAPSPGPLVYRLIHEGDDVGSLKMSVLANGPETVIYTVIDIGVTLAYVIPVLEYRHESTEIWRNGGFHRFDGITVDNGREHAITVLLEDNGLRLLKAGDPSAFHDAMLLSWTVWCEAALKTGRLLNPLKGRTKEFSARLAGDETTTLEGVSISGRRYDVEFRSPDGSDGHPGALW